MLVHTCFLSCCAEHGQQPLAACAYVGSTSHISLCKYGPSVPTSLLGPASDMLLLRVSCIGWPGGQQAHKCAKPPSPRSVGICSSGAGTRLSFVLPLHSCVSFRVMTPKLPDEGRLCVPVSVLQSFWLQGNQSTACFPCCSFCVER
jgi:hypothetical protein